MERATVVIFGTLLAWIALVMVVAAIGTDDKVDAGLERIRILKSHPVPIVPIPPFMTPDPFMLIGQDEHLSQRP